jgi:hypothetical protein
MGGAGGENAGGMGGIGGASASSGGNGGSGEEEALPNHEIECHLVLNTGACYEGRRHTAVESAAAGRGPTAAAAWLSRAARAEAASVKAFLALRDELRAHGAPSELLAAARDAAADEVRHARAMGQLVEAAGGEPAPPVKDAKPVARSLFELALENAVEGCVLETFGALLAMHQARHARDAAIRDAMAAIAEDEARHGELAWAIHRWVCGLLTDVDAAALRDAMSTAATNLAHALGDDDLPADARSSLGLPEPAHAVALARATQVYLWS